MNTARIVVLTVAIGAGSIAAYLASGSDYKPAGPAAPVAQMQTIDVLIAKSDIGIGQTVKPEDLQWQTWPAATASNTFIRRGDQAPKEKDGTNALVGKTVTLELKPEQSETLARARQTGTLALRSITDANAVEVMSDEQGSRRGESVSVVRYGLASSQTVQK
jgi:pilus assembly protein CpaB